MTMLIEKAACLVRHSAIALVVLAGLTLGYFTFQSVHHGGSEAGGVAAVAARLASSNGWETRPDPWRPGGVVFLVDPKRCQRSVSVSSLQITALEEWEGIVRIESVVTASGQVDPRGGFVWRGLWFFGDQRMLDRILPDLR
jgi:hypothetical protein